MNCFSFADAEISPLVHARAMPADGELHIWCWTSSDVADDALTTLSTDERALHSRFATPELRQRFLASHAGLRNILAGYVGAAARELAFQQTAAGKPYLSGTTLQFNLSHSADANLLAVATAEVGVDIERVRSLTSLSSLAARHFAPPELEALRSAADPQRTFFTTWTRKEAIIKLVGLGLAAGVQDLDTTTIHEGIAVPASWAFPTCRCGLAELDVGSQHCAAVAMGDLPHRVLLFRTGGSDSLPLP